MADTASADPVGFQQVSTRLGAFEDVLRLKGLPVAPVIGQGGIEIRDVLRFVRVL